MANEVIKATLQIEVDSAKAKTALQGFKREMQSTTTSLNQGGQQASRAFGSIGQAAVAASAKIQAAGQRALALLDMQSERLSATSAEYARLRALQAGGQGTGGQTVSTVEVLTSFSPGERDGSVAVPAAAAPGPAQAGGSIPRLLEQGSQLNDVMEGSKTIFNAAGLIVPRLTLAGTALTAAAATLGAAVYSGSEEISRYNEALSLTGGFAGYSAQELDDMARRIAGSSGTVSSASEALARIAATGRISGSAIEQIGLAAVSMRDTTGQSIDETVRQYALLADAPSKTLAALNRQQHFLTEEQYDQVVALEKQGLMHEAATKAQLIYANVQVEQVERVKRGLGTLQKVWMSVKSAASQAWSAMANLGREDDTGTLQQQAETLRQSIASIEASKEQARQALAKGGAEALKAQVWLGSGPASADGMSSQLRRQLAGIESQLATRSAAANEARAAAQVQADADARIDKKDASMTSGKPAVRVIVRTGNAVTPAQAQPTEPPKTKDLVAEWLQNADRLLDGIKTSQASRNDQARQALTAMGMSDRDAQRAGASASLAKEFQQYVDQLTKSRPAELSDPDFNQKIGAVQGGMQTALAAQQSQFEREDSAQGSWYLGAQKALGNFVVASEDGFGMIRNATSGWLTSFDEKLTQTVLTGKTKFSDLVNSILADMARIAVRQSITGPLMGLVSTGLGMLFGATSTPGISAAAGATQGGQLFSSLDGMTTLGSGSTLVLGGRANGGPTVAGGLYEVNERDPELYTASGRTWLMAGGSDGYVTPITAGGAATAGGSVVNVGVTINGGGDVQSKAPGGYEQFAQEIGIMIDQRFQQLQGRSYKQGGMAWQQRNGRV